jgi:hypothetical protein
MEKLPAIPVSLVMFQLMEKALFSFHGQILQGILRMVDRTCCLFFPTNQSHMKPYHTHLTVIFLSALASLAAHAAELESTTPVAAKTNGEAWWWGAPES